MKPMVLLLHPPTTIPSSPWQWKLYSVSPIIRNKRHRFSCSSSIESTNQIKQNDTTLKTEYKPGIFDEFFLNSFRNKLIQEVGWDSEKPGYDGLIELVNGLLIKGKTNNDAKDAAVRILKSFFPPLLLELYKTLIAPIAGGKVAAMMVARVTVLTCQWLMGPSTVNSVDLPNGLSWKTGVFVERCKYLEESKCVGVCINTCKLPTQSFFKDYMGVPLLMEPNFTDYSCQFKFGVDPPSAQDDSALREPCLEICPTASRRKEVSRKTEVMQCPKA